jgi:dGTPase
MMAWSRLLSRVRLRRPNAPALAGRNVFQADRDRIVFSSAFRRLADKTQVHPLSENDHVRTRLTHSIEVASVGRSLGTMVGERIAAQVSEVDVSPHDFGYIVEAACLAHDLGNPPFGHSGEQAISDWFNDCEGRAKRILPSLSEHRRYDFQRFEGNAQGFRIITNLENRKENGGLQLSYAVLGAFSKYPYSSNNPKEKYVGWKKYGFFETEKLYFQDLADEVGLIKEGNLAWRRHPLTFLTEAADDICYHIIDLEDGFEVKRVVFDTARKYLMEIAGPVDNSYMALLSEREQISYMRACAIDRLVKEVAETFLEHKNGIMLGTVGNDGESLINLTRKGKILEEINLEEIKCLTREHVYRSELVVPFEIAGAECIGGLLDAFCAIALDLESKNFNYSRINLKNRQINEFYRIGLELTRNTADAVTRIVDYISGMTDRFAISSYRKIKGISF